MTVRALVKAALEDQGEAGTMTPDQVFQWGEEKLGEVPFRAASIRKEMTDLSRDPNAYIMRVPGKKRGVYALRKYAHHFQGAYNRGKNGKDDAESNPHHDSRHSHEENEIMHFSAGPGVAGGPIVRSRSELEVTTGLTADGLEPIFVEGDSMEPEIRANSWAWIRPVERIQGPGIYAVEIDAHRFVKRFDIRMGGVLRVSGADEKRYPAEEWEPLEESGTFNLYRSLTTNRSAEITVRGRVVAYTRVT